MHECLFVLVDPQCADCLGAAHKLVVGVLVALPLLKGLVSHKDLGLSIDTKSLPSPVCVISVNDYDAQNIAFSHGKFVLQSNGWMHIFCYCKNYKRSFCHPLLWFVVFHGISPLKPRACPCPMVTDDGEQGQFELSNEIAQSA